MNSILQPQCSSLSWHCSRCQTPGMSSHRLSVLRERVVVCRELPIPVCPATADDIEAKSPSKLPLMTGISYQLSKRHRYWSCILPSSFSIIQFSGVSPPVKSSENGSEYVGLLPFAIVSTAGSGSTPSAYTERFVEAFYDRQLSGQEKPGIPQYYENRELTSRPIPYKNHAMKKY